MKIVNIKLNEKTQERMKIVSKEKGLTMQAVYAAFSESFIENPDKYKIKMEVGMEISIDEMNGTKYIVHSFDTFNVREVIKKDKQTGEYHIKFKKGNPIETFKKVFSPDSIGYIDPDGALLKAGCDELEYPVYMKISNSLMISCMLENFKNINQKLKEI